MPVDIKKKYQRSDCVHLLFLKTNFFKAKNLKEKKGCEDLITK